MDIVDKRGVLATVSAHNTIELELGCGPRKRHASAIGTDILDYPGVDIVGDVFSVLRALPSRSVSACYSYHFLEHVDDVPSLLRELGRVITATGTVIALVPHFSNPYFYSDYTHRRFFGLYTFSYLCNDGLLRRKVPKYQREADFAIAGVRLIFRSPFAGRIRKFHKRAATWLFNRSTAHQEFYEEHLCWLLPCYEIEFRLTPISR